MSRLFTLAVLLPLLVPGAAEACSVCFSTTEENRFAFLATTLFLSVAPLAILAGIGSWLRRKVFEAEREHEAARAAAQASHARDVRRAGSPNEPRRLVSGR